jgi:HD-like signal output (HDOD) protein
MTDNKQSLLDIIKEHLAAEKLQLWVFPRVALELQELLNQPDYSVDHVAKLILKDQVLSSQILRIANSAFFAGLKKVSTIREAIIRLGTRQLLNCVVMVTQRNFYRAGNEVIAGYMQSLWQHALGCALGTRWFLEKTGYRDLSQEGFLAGLFHDIGKLFLLNILEKIHNAGRVDIDVSKPLILEILDGMHPDCGYNLLKQWNIPDAYCDIARDHHKQEFDTNDILLVVVRLVNQGCCKMGLGMNHDPSVVLAGLPEAHALGVKEVLLAELEIMLEDTMSLNF